LGFGGEWAVKFLNFSSTLGLGALSLGLLGWGEGVIAAEPIAQALDAPLMEEDSAATSPVLSVDELSDVRPTDWAFQSVKTLIERYGLMNESKLFRGDRPLTRFEFARALSVVMEQVAPIATTDDIKMIRKLQELYREALTDVQLRLTDLENRESLLTSRDFSTTTKLSGMSDHILTNGSSDSKGTVVSRVRVNLDTSFGGKDLLVTQFEAGNNGLDAVGLNQVRQGGRLASIGSLVDGGGLDAVGVAPGLRLRKLYYSFPLSKTFQLTVGSVIPPSDFIDRNTFANNSGRNFASRFFMNNPLIVQNPVERVGGAGVVAEWALRKEMTLRGLLVSAGSNDSQVGLFRDQYQATLEGEYRFPTKPITVRVQYTNAITNGSQINAVGVSGEWAASRQVGAFARLGIGQYSGFNTALRSQFDATPLTWSIGGILRNFVIPGSKAGLAIGQPFATNAVGNATQTNVEAYFGLLLNDRINFTPSILYVINPDNQVAPSVWQWGVRMSFEF
jgi:Carbohydrate-selective porin, OprB family/S-layer homology domain